jgi:cytochrome c
VQVGNPAGDGSRAADALAAKTREAHTRNAAIEGYGCGSCHTIPGVEGADATVGPPLDGFAERTYVAGVLPNLPGPLSRWIMHPQQIVPGNAMPNLGIGRGEARDIAQYRYGLD